MPENYYDVLGVAWTATSYQIQQAYFAQIRSLPPDCIAPSRFREAFVVLRGLESRNAYNSTLGLPPVCAPQTFCENSCTQTSEKTVSEESKTEDSEEERDMGNTEIYGHFTNREQSPGIKVVLIHLLTRREVYLPVIVVLLLILASAVTVGYVKSCFFPVGRYQAFLTGHQVTVIDTQTGTTRTFNPYIQK